MVPARVNTHHVGTTLVWAPNSGGMRVLVMVIVDPQTRVLGGRASMDEARHSAKKAHQKTKTFINIKMSHGQGLRKVVLQRAWRLGFCLACGT